MRARPRGVLLGGEAGPQLLDVGAVQRAHLVGLGLDQTFEYIALDPDSLADHGLLCMLRHWRSLSISPPSVMLLPIGCGVGNMSGQGPRVEEMCLLVAHPDFARSTHSKLSSRVRVRFKISAGAACP